MTIHLPAVNTSRTVLLARVRLDSGGYFAMTRLDWLIVFLFSACVVVIFYLFTIGFMI
jgi:hypothetical protein